MGARGSTSAEPLAQHGAAAKNVGRFSVASRYHIRDGRHIENDYHVIDRVLGSGCNGVVRMAVSKNTQVKQNFAVKAFKLSSLGRDKKEQLQSEVSVFLGMDHPHIARLYDVYDSGDVMYMVMECLDGGELFERVHERKCYSESDAAAATRQMLLALNYLHTHGIVHRDLKLENFLYDAKDGDHLKLIDFGFSRVWDPNIKMHVSCGTLSYVAPEVLQKNYTVSCDMWSLGVIAFILLSGYMPFAGSEQVQQRNILTGNYRMKPERWGKVSRVGIQFVKDLLQVVPERRMTAQQALSHPWINATSAQADVEIDAGIVEGLMQFGRASKFRRCCMEMMAWSLSNQERARVREYFIAMDKNKHGTITLQEFKQVMVDKFHIQEEETLKVFAALDSNSDESIHYTDFLAAMLDTRIVLHDDLIRSAFRRFDADNSGFISLENLHEVVGNEFEGETVEVMLAEADVLKDNRISYAEFVSYLRRTPLEKSEDVKKVVAEKIIEHEMSKNKVAPSRSMEFKQSFWEMPQALRFRTRLSKSGSESHTSCVPQPVAPPPAAALPSTASGTAPPPSWLLPPTLRAKMGPPAAQDAVPEANGLKKPPTCCCIS